MAVYWSMRATWITLCILVGGCFSDVEGSSEVGTTGDASESESSEDAAADTTPGTTSTSTSGASESSDASTSESDGSESDGTTSETGAGSTGDGAGVYEPCVADEDCESGACLVADGAGAGYCTLDCVEHTDCPGAPVACAPFGACMFGCTIDEDCPDGTACDEPQHGGMPYPGICG